MKLRDAIIGTPVILRNHIGINKSPGMLDSYDEGQVGHISGFSKNSVGEIILKIKGTDPLNNNAEYSVHASNVERLEASQHIMKKYLTIAAERN